MSDDRQPFDPKTTVFTNLALDKIMPRVSPNAWKVLCLAQRKTQGWADPDSPTGRKQSDVISLSQFMAGCGIVSRNTAIAAVNECVRLGYLVRSPDGRSYRYSLNLTYSLPATSAENAPVQESNQRENRASASAKIAPVEAPTSAKIAPELARKSRTQTVRTLSSFNTKGTVSANAGDHITPAERKRYHLTPDLPEPSAAVKIYLHICNAFAKPQTALEPTRQAIDAVVTADRLDAWEQVCRQWLLSGYRPENVNGLLDMFANGGKNGRRPANMGAKGSGAQSAPVFSQNDYRPDG